MIILEETETCLLKNVNKQFKYPCKYFYFVFWRHKLTQSLIMTA